MLHPKIKKLEFLYKKILHQKKAPLSRGLVAAAGASAWGARCSTASGAPPAIAPRGAPHRRSAEPPPNSGCASSLQGEEGRRRGMGP